MLIYRAGKLPDAKRTAEIWRTEAQRLGFPDLYLCWVESWGRPPGGPEAFGLDASVGFMPTARKEIFAPLEGARAHHLMDYEAAYQTEMRRAPPPWKRFPSVMVGWDNTARRQQGATIFTGATPEAYERWLQATADSLVGVRAEENYLFILAWNEWAEGNHLEPDQQYGRAFLEATRAVLLERPGRGPAPTGKPRIASGDHRKRVQTSADGFSPPDKFENVAAKAARLIRDLFLDRDGTVATLGVSPEIAREWNEQGIEATHLELSDGAELPFGLDLAGNVSSLVLLDVLEHLPEPHRLLARLSAWSLKHGEPTLVLAVPNVSHFDVGLRLICGRWVPTDQGILASTNHHFFTEETLCRLLDRCGWQVVARNDLESVDSEQYDAHLNDALPAEMIGALRVLAQACNATMAVEQFVWALKPAPVTAPPTTLLQAIEDPRGVFETRGFQVDAIAIDDYLGSVGLVASETNRRAAKQLRSTDYPGFPWWKRHLLRATKRSPRFAEALRKVESRIR